jgi:t-SNARE complex subunit (syntaxin)
MVHWCYRTDYILIWGQGGTTFTTATAVEKITQPAGLQPYVIVIIVVVVVVVVVVVQCTGQ